jgi:hypothetical protein
MQKYIALSRQCDDNACENEEDFWKRRHNCNQSKAAEYREDRYNEPYYYEPPWGRTTLAKTPSISRQFTAGVCGINQATEYAQQFEGYKQCQRCERQGMCWSSEQRKCIECSNPGQCERKWGCPNPNGEEFAHVAPKDPMYTDCKPCWRR